MKQLLALFMALSGAGALAAQPVLAGRWEGYITQAGTADQFYYQIELEQQGGQFSGRSLSRSADGSATARFQLSGAWDGQLLALQELKQLEPSNPWCLKYSRLHFRQEAGMDLLEGEWQADGCAPGQVRLSRPSSAPPLAGKWAGTLSQSDRDYGFYFEMELQPGAAGQSFIVSEDNGGSAFMRLRWELDERTASFAFRESEVSSKTDARWPWCIKSGELQFRQEGSRLVLEGSWSGYIEGFDMKTGTCASGKVYLEKPLPTPEGARAQARVQAPYEAETGRQMKVARVIEVQKPNLKIRVWDNGVVDGDVATLFLNGERILNQHRVTKRKVGINVTLKEEDNFLVLHAEDLGDIPPNTVAISIDDGVREQVLILNSNLQESGAVLVRQFRLGN